MTYDQLKLENQVCFPLYALSRLITRAYQPFLNQLEITYPQYLVLMVLWEHDSTPVNDIAKKLILNTNTITPLVKRMEQQGLIKRERSEEDKRKILVQLTKKGSNLKEEAAKIPEKLEKQLDLNEDNFNDLTKLKENLNAVIQSFTSKQ